MNYNYDSAKHESRTLEFQAELERILERSLTENEFKKVAWLNGMGQETAETFSKLFLDCYSAGMNS